MDIVRQTQPPVGAVASTIVIRSGEEAVTVANGRRRIHDQQDGLPGSLTDCAHGREPSWM
jgi:hypothetical protein